MAGNNESPSLCAQGVGLGRGCEVSGRGEGRSGPSHAAAAPVNGYVMVLPSPAPEKFNTFNTFNTFAVVTPA